MKRLRRLIEVSVYPLNNMVWENELPRSVDDGINRSSEIIFERFRHEDDVIFFVPYHRDAVFFRIEQVIQQFRLIFFQYHFVTKQT